MPAGFPLFGNEVQDTKIKLRTSTWLLVPRSILSPHFQLPTKIGYFFFLYNARLDSPTWYL
jgi:hypothetical protein